VDTTDLVEDRRRTGEELIRALDRARFPVSAAFWLRQDEPTTWRLIIASPSVREQGPDHAYQKIQTALSELGEPRIQLTDIWVVKDTEPIVKALKAAIHTGPNDIRTFRVHHSTASGVYIDGAYVYRST
jgi:hypothetical protein